MTELLFRTDAYLCETTADVVAHTIEGGIILDRSIFYPNSGGQPGDSGTITWARGEINIATTVKGEGDQIVLVPAEPRTLPPIGATVDTTLDWDRRFAHMRMHSALHLLSVALPFGVTGGSVGAGRGRLDFDMEAAPENRNEIEEALNAFVSADMRISDEWITEGELAQNPKMIKTLAVQPPRGSGYIRLVRIGDGIETIDLQPCGGTHVLRTGEIGTLRIGKIEKKGRKNRRVYLYSDV
jgi:misacylated tRNA(Ala) deacylase